MPDYIAPYLPVITALLGVWLGQHWQGNREHRHWLREKRLELYIEAVNTLHQRPIWKIRPGSDTASALDTLEQLLDPELPLHLRMETLSDLKVRTAWDKTTKAAVALRDALAETQASEKPLPMSEVRHFETVRGNTANAIRYYLT